MDRRHPDNAWEAPDNDLDAHCHPRKRSGMPGAPTTAHLHHVGLIGLGNIGMHYAERLLKASDTLTVHDGDPNRIEVIVEAGARAARSSRELAELSETIVLALPSPQSVEKALLGEGGVLVAERKRLLIVDASTIDPDTSGRLYDAAKSRGHDYLEAPMSGGEPGGAGQSGAKAGTVTFIVGGDRPAFEAAPAPVFDALGRHAIHVGPIGTGNLVTLISNLIAGLQHGGHGRRLRARRRCRALARDPARGVSAYRCQELHHVRGVRAASAGQ